MFLDPWGGKWDLLQPPAEPLNSDEAWPVSLERQVLFWAIAATALLYVVYLLGSTITPFAAGIALGYLLDPVVLKLQRLGLNRLGASLLISAASALAVAIILILVAPILGNQLVAFSQRLPGYAVRLQELAIDEGNALIAKYGGPWLQALGLKEQVSSAQIQKSIGDFVGQGAQWLINGLKSVVSGGAAVFNFLSLLIITPVVAFYILVDWDTIIAEIDSWLPLDHRDSLRKLAREMNDALAGFIRGQSIVCLFLGLWYSIGLTLIGLDFGFLIGVLGGVLELRAVCRVVDCVVLSLGVALVQGWPSLKLFLLALAVVGTGHIFEGNVLSPKLVGESIGLHPVWLMFALLAFGQLFGFLGLLIAVPTAAAIGVVSRHLIALYLTSVRFIGAARPRRASHSSAASADVSLAAFDEFRTRGFSAGAVQPRGAAGDGSSCGRTGRVECWSLSGRRGPEKATGTIWASCCWCHPRSMERRWTKGASRPAFEPARCWLKTPTASCKLKRFFST